MEEKKTGSRGKLIREVAWLEGIILVILIGFSAILIVGQIHANQSITNAGRAIQEAAFLAASSCRNVANLSLLLQIRLVKSAEADNSPEEVVPLHRNLIAYLERLSGSLDMWLKKDPDRTTSWEQRGALEETWKTAVFSLSGYLNPNGNIEESPCFRLFGQRDHTIIMKLYQEIDKQITALTKEAA